jgi:hypothetical protein
MVRSYILINDKLKILRYVEFSYKAGKKKQKLRLLFPLKPQVKPLPTPKPTKPVPHF